MVSKEGASKKGASVNWQKQQALFGQALVDPALSVPEFVRTTSNNPSIKRFNVYRNNIMVSLTEAIVDTYPVLSQLVGEEFATAMARVYVGDHLPSSPVLLEYGKGYADFVEGFEPAQNLPFLADMARLEWAWMRSYHAKDETPLTIDVLSEIAPDELIKTRLVFCESVQLLRSDHPIATIWSAHQEGSAATELEKIPDQEEYVLVNRPLWDVEVRLLDPSTHAFFSSLQAGFPLGVSIDKGNTFSSFEPAAAINALFETNVIAALKE